MLNLKEIIKNNTATFSFYRSGYAYYDIFVNGQSYMFPIELKDLDGASLMATHKAITLMCFIRQALENETFVKVN